MELVATPSRPRQRLADPKSKARSRVSNGNDLLPGDVDGRSAIARRYRDISSAMLLDQGGADRCSESRKQLIRRFAAAAVLAEQMESRLANGEEIDIAKHSLLVSTMVRVAQRIGVERVAKNITPSLQTYLAHKGRTKPVSSHEETLIDVPTEAAE